MRGPFHSSDRVIVALHVSRHPTASLPGFHVRGMPPSWFNGPPPPGQANMGWKFPELLGKMSTRNKRHRQLMEMHTAMQGRCSGGRMDLLTFVLPALVLARMLLEFTFLRGN